MGDLSLPLAMPIRLPVLDHNAVVDELIYTGYSVKKHFQRAKALLRAIRDLRIFQLKQSIDRVSIAHIHDMYQTTLQGLRVAQAPWIDGGSDHYALTGDAEADIGILIVHASPGFCETTLEFAPLLAEVTAAYQWSPEEAEQVFGTSDPDIVANFFLQNYPPLFASNTHVGNEIYTRTFIVPMNFEDLLSHDPVLQARGWMSSLLYTVHCLRYLHTKGYRIIGGGGYIPALTSNCTFYKFEKSLKMQKYAKPASVLNKFPGLRNLVRSKSFKFVLALGACSALQLLKHVDEVRSSFPYKELTFTSGHTGTVALAVMTLRRLIKRELSSTPDKRSVRLGFLGAGCTISLATLEALYDTEFLPFDVEVYSPDKDKLKKAKKLLQDDHKPFHISSCFSDLVFKSDIIFSSVAALPADMSGLLESEYEGFKARMWWYMPVLEKKTFVESMYPSVLPLDRIRELGGSVVHVVGNFPSTDSTTTLKRMQLHDCLNESKTECTYGLSSSPGGTADYGCGSELLTIIWKLRQTGNHWDLSGPILAENVKQLADVWETQFPVEPAPQQE